MTHTTHTARATFSERLYRLCLRVYPREFRDEYGDEMSFLFAARAQSGRVSQAVWLWLQVLRDLCVHAPREHWGMVTQDARHAWRTWRRAPAIPAIALTALTFGMGANIAIFSVVHAVLLRPLPVRQPERLLVLREVSPSRAMDESAVSLPNYLSWAERARGLDLAAYSGQTLTWSGDGVDRPERLEALAPTASFLSVIGGSLQSGRWFTPEDADPAAPRVAVLSHRLWRTRFGEDPTVVGRQLTLNRVAYTVIGVASPTMSVPSEPDLWVPQVIDPAQAQAQAPARRGNRYLAVVGRLKPDVTRERAQAEMTSIARGLAQEFPNANKDWTIGVVPLADSLMPTEIRTALVVLFAAAAMVLLIACANVANVLLSRAAARRKEIAIRTALGAGATRIARQLLTESLLLSVAGAALGLLLATGVIRLARRALIDLVPRVDLVTLNVTVFVFALVLALATGLAFGLAPLWHVRGSHSGPTRPRPRTDDRGTRVRRARHVWGSRRHGDGRAGADVATRRVDPFHAAPSVLGSGRDDRAFVRNRLRSVLVVAQVSLTTLLLIGGALLVQSLLRLQHVPIGVNADGVLTAKLSLTRARLPNGPAIGEFLSRLTDDVQRAPGIRSAGISSAIPLSPGAYTITRIAAEADPFTTCEWRLVDSGYFRTFQIPLLRGRLFGADDTKAGAPRVFVISQQAARALYGDADPVGRRLRLDNGSSGEVIGVVADVRMRDPGDPPERVVYFPPAQFGFFPLFNVVVRTDGAVDAASAAAVIRDRLKTLDPAMAAYEIQQMQHWVDRKTALMRIRTTLVTSLGAVALLLGVIGIYGVMSYLVTLRTREFGIRIALGARPRALPLVVVRQGLHLTFAGLVIGVVTSLLLVDRLQTLLFEVNAHDPATFLGVATLVAAIAVIASYIPARRAAHADPLTVLRAE